MNGCIYRTKDGECDLWNKDRNCAAFCHPNCENIHPTNADRIRSMTDEELAEFLDDVLTDGWNAWEYEDLKYPASDASWLEWLQQEVDDNALR